MFNVLTGLVFLAGGFLIHTFHAAGLIILLIIVYKFFGRMFGKFINFIRLIMTEHKTFFSKPGVRLIGLVLLISMVYGLIFYSFPQHIDLPATLEPNHQSTIRVHEAGYVETVDINKLAYKKNEEILVQRNQEILDQLKAVAIDLQSNNLLQQAALALGDSAEQLKLTKLRQQLIEAKNDLKRRQANLTLIAPFNGVFDSNLNSLAHTILSPGDPIGRFVDTSVYKVVIDILERDIEGIQMGTHAYFILNNQPDVIFSGKVSRISPMHIMKGIARFYRVSVEFPNKNMAMREGMTGSVYLKIGHYTYLYRFIRWLKKTIRLDLQL